MEKVQLGIMLFQNLDQQVSLQTRKSFLLVLEVEDGFSSFRKIVVEMMQTKVGQLPLEINPSSINFL